MVVWTHSAKSKINQHGLTEDMVLATFNSPDRSAVGNIPGSSFLQKRFESSTVSVITKKNDRGEWLIISCWIDNYRSKPVHHKEHYNPDNKSLIGKIIRDIKYILRIR
jgi:hypothetical protein